MPIPTSMPWNSIWMSHPINNGIGWEGDPGSTHYSAIWCTGFYPTWYKTCSTLLMHILSIPNPPSWVIERRVELHHWLNPCTHMWHQSQLTHCIIYLKLNGLNWPKWNIYTHNMHQRSKMLWDCFCVNPAKCVLDMWMYTRNATLDHRPRAWLIES